ncbi:hypothetical protein U9M48_020665 [Paspalum notatum var. saurae]|uniref:F-box domain-containing protein n=1 Tax=Paspalum notatum var. saurae TaxID=547442 RepID=A0AAQ3THX3_PASNO
MASGADRISNLPEGVLHHILALLPAQDAVRTCVLAQSWRDHWRSVPAVRFAGPTDWAGGVDVLIPFVDGLLRARRRVAPLDSCEFDLDLDESDVPKIERRGNSWIRRAMRLGVWELFFRFSVTTRRFAFTLEERRLASQHLTRLELMGVQGNNAVLDFSGCPALEHLKMEECDVSSTEIQSPSLKYLTIQYCLFYTNYRTRMWFPSLVSFDLIANVGRVPMLESMPSLETAVYVFIRDLDWCPAFSKLKTLVLSEWFVTADLGALLWFIFHAPLLEELTLEVSVEHKKLIKKDGSYQPFEQSIATTHLQSVEIICKHVNRIVCKILKALNSIGIALEIIRIQCSDHFSYLVSVIHLCVLISTPTGCDMWWVIDGPSRLLKYY